MQVLSEAKGRAAADKHLGHKDEDEACVPVAAKLAKLEGMVQLVLFAVTGHTEALPVGPLGWGFGQDDHHNAHYAPMSAISNTTMRADAEEFKPTLVPSPSHQNAPDAESDDPTSMARCQNWLPSASNQFAREGTQMHNDLREEAAVVIQKWWAKLNGNVSEGTSTPGNGDSDEAEEIEEESDGSDPSENSPEQLAVRRAFMATVNAGSPQGEVQAEWTDQQISVTIDAGLALAAATGDADYGAVIFWREWAALEPHVPVIRRKGIITFFDSKLNAKGFPSLRDLVSMDPFPVRPVRG